MPGIQSHFLLLLSLVSLVSCHAKAGSAKPGDDVFEVVSHHQATNCGSIMNSQWLSSQQLYEPAFQAIFQGIISDSKPVPPEIDFNTHGMLLISMGQRRTGGYSVKLASSQMRLGNNRAIIAVKWISAKPGMITIQMLTNPCLLLQVPKGDYQVFDIVDQSGKVRQRIAID